MGPSWPPQPKPANKRQKKGQPADRSRVSTDATDQQSTLTQAWAWAPKRDDDDVDDSDDDDDDVLVIDLQADDSELDLEEEELQLLSQRAQLSQSENVEDLEAQLRDDDDDDEEEQEEQQVDGIEKRKAVIVQGIMFKEGETWKTIGKNGLAEAYYFLPTIVTRKLLKVGGSGTKVFVPLESTVLLGEFGNMMLQEDRRWHALHPKCPHLAVCANPNDTGLLRPLFKLKERSEEYPLDQPPACTLNFHCGPKQTRGEGFDVAYYYEGTVPFTIGRDPVVLDLFAGGGGLGRGFKKAGFNVKYMVEMNRASAATLRRNHPKGDGSRVYDEGVDLFLSRAMDKDPIYPQPGDVDHIHCSSPCQGYSTANRRGGKNDKTNNELSFRFFRAVAYYMPTTASFENVTGMLRDCNIECMRLIVRELLALGYQVRLSIVNASDYGDAQDRQRVILFAARTNVKLPRSRPDPTHGDDKPGLLPKTTVQDVLGDLEHVAPKPGSGLVELPSGKIVSCHNIENTELKGEDLDDKKKSSNNSLQVAMNQPPLRPHRQQATTLLRQKPTMHYRLDRYYTVRERARLQGFPDDYEFEGRLTERLDQVGNAVPVGLADAFGRTILEQSYNVIKSSNDSS